MRRVWRTWEVVRGDGRDRKEMGGIERRWEG